MTKERPVLYSTHMVHSILEDRKTMTRRTKDLEVINEDPDRWEYIRFFDGHAKFCEKHNHINEQKIKCPYGKPGDLLWVREKFGYYQDNKTIFKYRTEVDEKERGFYKWKPSIHMPKTAARIWLEITNVRVERLRDISSNDAKSEGIEYVIDKITGYCGYDYKNGGYNLMTTPYHGFRSLWEQINGEESWKANPWVWVIEFKVISKTGKPSLNQ